MGRKSIDRTGEKSINNFGSEMIITEYRKYSDIDVYFPEYNWTYKGTRYSDFKNGNIKCPYERRYYGVGYLGEGKYKAKENGKDTAEYAAMKAGGFINSRGERGSDYCASKDYVPIDNSDLIPKVLRWYKNGFNINNFYNIYPELKDKFIEELERATKD